jgi:apolipoprotein D and lipocalin family protein
MKKQLLILLAMISIASCKPSQNLTTVEKVDIQKYAGQWYEIARLPNGFERDLECVTANYSLKKNGKIEVLNQGYSIKDKSKVKKAKGTAWVPDSAFPGRLKVSFFWPFAGNYYIISLDKNYTYALVGDPTRKYLWVLARSSKLDENIYSELLEIAGTHGFDTGAVIRVNQDCH